MSKGTGPLDQSRLLEWLQRLGPATATACAVEPLGTLWGGYGQILRARMADPDAKSLIVKMIRPPAGEGGASHDRKLRSYEIERRWYRTYAARCDESCRVPKFVAQSSWEGQSVLALEDLDAAGFPSRGDCRDPVTVQACLAWLANFHATFMGSTSEGLWTVGTYWHLATRTDELRMMRDQRLREAAGAIDACLNACQNVTLVHGDAKPANFCLSRDADKVAVVDFQYTGGGCGMKDVVYFLDSVLDEAVHEREALPLLDRYFKLLRVALAQKHPACDANAVELEWRRLYPMAWGDFYRFLSGWAPGMPPARGHAAKMIDAALRRA